MFNENLRKVRIEKNMKQYELAEKIKSTRSYISKLETNVTEPSLDMLIKIANTLECSVDYLLGRENEEGNVIIEGNRDINISDNALKLVALFEKLNRLNQMQAILYCEGLLIGQNNAF